jgi:hypothetical protein
MENMRRATEFNDKAMNQLRNQYKTL